LLATFSPNYMGVGGLVARNSRFTEAGFVAKIFGWVGPVAKPVAKIYWAPSSFFARYRQGPNFKKKPWWVCGRILLMVVLSVEVGFVS
jgi:hypothetical protein